MLAPEPTNHPIPQNPQRHVVMAAITAPGESPDYHFQMIRQEGGPARPGPARSYTNSAPTCLLSVSGKAESDSFGLIPA